ncbi:MAG: redoxin domain-containing protein [Gammaproteobacteria bacterium]|nr:redoxin domain-containing protein [Gammaproteobacteria bacterium]
MLKKIKPFYRGWRKYLIEGLAIIIVITLVRQYQQRDVVSGLAPPIQGVMLDNTRINWQDYRSKPLLIHFWASWCPVCRLEESSIASIAKDYQLLSIASWSDDTVSYMQQRGLDFPTLNDIDGKWAKRYGISAVPTSVIVNPAGQIYFVESGFSSEWGLRLRLWWLQI